MLSARRTDAIFSPVKRVSASCSTHSRKRKPTAKPKSNEIPNLRCDIYDHTGKSKPPLLTYVNKIHLKAGSKRAKWGWVLVAASLPCFWIEHHWGNTLVVPMVIGVNLVFAGLRLVYWGKGGVEKRRAVREKQT